MATTDGNAACHVIIPTAGRDRALLAACVDALQLAAADRPFDLTIVVCPAEEADPEAIGALAPQARIVTLAGPFNFARSINAGRRERSNARTVLLLNDDCRFLRAGDLGALIAMLERERVACIGPWVIALNRPHDGYPAVRSRGFIQTRTPVMGCCALWDRAWLDRIGDLDERFGIGYGFDEADLLYRARMLGGRWGRNDSIAVEHTNHATFGIDVLQSSLFRDNIWRFKEKYPDVHPWGDGPEWEPLPLADENPPAKRSAT